MLSLCVYYDLYGYFMVNVATYALLKFVYNIVSYWKDHFWTGLD